MEKQVKFILVASIIVIAVLALLAISQISGFTIFNTSSSAISILGRATLDSGEIDCSKLDCSAAAFRTNQSACVLSDCCRWNATAIKTSSLAWHTGACSKTKCPSGTIMIKCESRTLSVMTTRITQKREVCANYTNTCLTKNCAAVTCDAYKTDKTECIATECCRYNQSAVSSSTLAWHDAVNQTVVSGALGALVVSGTGCNASLCPADTIITKCSTKNVPIAVGRLTLTKKQYQEICTNSTGACLVKNCSAIDCNSNKADKDECLATQCCMWDASGISTSSYGWHTSACSETRCPAGTVMTKCEDRTTSAGKEHREICTNYTDTCKIIVKGEVGEVSITEAKVNCSGVNCVLFNRSQTTCLSSECCAWNQTALDSNIYRLGWHTGACNPSKCATFPQYKEFSNCESRRVWAGFTRAFTFREEVSEICGDFSTTCKSKICADVNCKELNTSQAACVATGCCNWDQSAIKAIAWHSGACSITKCPAGSTMRCESKTLSIPRTGTWGVTRITQNREICTNYNNLCASSGVAAPTVGITAAPNCSAVNCLQYNTTQSSCTGTNCCNWNSGAITTTKLVWHTDIIPGAAHCNNSFCPAGSVMTACESNTTIVPPIVRTGKSTTLRTYREVCTDTSAACFAKNCSQVSCSLYNQSQPGCANSGCCNWNQNEVTASFLGWHLPACSAARCPGNTILLKCEKQPLAGVPVSYQYREICAEYKNTCAPIPSVPIPCTLNIGQDVIMTDDIDCTAPGEGGTPPVPGPGEEGAAVIINIPNAVLDCNGHNIVGNGTGYGIYIRYDNATIKNCNISGFTTGIHSVSSRNQITSSRITNNANGIVIAQGGSNLIYDNFLLNTVNALESAGALPSSWNITRICSLVTNIIGGNCIGGNYWSDYTGSDTGGGVTISTVGDRIGDTNIPYNSGNKILSGGDFLPLVYLAGEACTDECSADGAKHCLNDTVYAVCGQYDNDTCWELSTPTSCLSGQTCQNGECITGTIPETCGNTVCAGNETCSSCSQDCGACSAETCGNNVCAGGETCTSCSQDCGACSTGGGGGGGGGGSGGNTYSPSAADLAKGYTRILRIGDRVRFMVGNISHYVSIDGVIWQPDLARVVQVTIASAPIKTTIPIGQTEKFDLDADGYYDVGVKLLNTIYNSAELFIQTIHESTAVAPAPKQVEQPAPVEEVPAEEIIEEEVQPSNITSYLLIAVIALVVVVLAIVLIRVLVKRKVSMKESPLILKAKSFVQEARRKGYSSQAIEQMMLEKGWKREDIERAM